ncbi:Putative membrane protein [Corynebacterium glyciniphilum AJ 3170]|uniref:Putative membrane protein n=1 Tax=Corynebacterium glyciniphilum AJ 3170 TaxID=1404245 RepID=X5DR38_9CORY|nr:hypothetical protein [Corynebacterium glyciniphilum]AHW63729.1 Putative membrane protein [Corynebacterium glyciniphilum AJ 3170]
MTTNQPPQPGRPSAAQQAIQQNHTGIGTPANYHAPLANPARTIDGFTAWTTVSALIFAICGLLTFIALDEVRYTEDLAFSIIFAIFSGAGFIGMILSRIGAAIRKAGTAR